MSKIKNRIKDLPARANAWACEHGILGWYLVLFLALNWLLDILQVLSHTGL
jgi:hypothetical protein